MAPVPKRIYASGLLDKNCCQACQDIDGTEYPDLAAAKAGYPAGGYKDCAGGSRCRGTLVFVWDSEADHGV